MKVQLVVRLLPLLAAISLAHPAPLIADSPWPAFRHDLLHTGRSTLPGPPRALPGWNRSLGGSGLASPATAGNTVYAVSGGSLFAFDSLGNELWSYNCASTGSSSPSVGTDGTIYVASTDSNLYALNADGTLKWKKSIGASSDASPTLGSDGSVYVGASTGKFTAFNSDGSVKFTYTAGSAVSSSAAIASDGTIYFGCDDGCLYALKSTGALKWKFSTSPASAVRSSPAIGTDGTVYFGATGGYFYAVYSGGTQRWRASTDGGVYSSPAIAADGSIYFGCRDDKLYCLNSNGAVKWKYTTGSYVDSCPAIDSNGTVYVGSNDSSVYAVNPDGSLLWSDSLGSPVLSSPAVGVSSSLYVLTYDGWIRSFIQDTTPPLLPTVIDDGQWSTSSTTLHASWSSSDPESGIADYQYAIGTSPGAQDVAPFTDAGLATQVTRTDLTLTNGATYYFAVTAVNGAGLTSAVGVSDGIRIDFTPPSTPAVTDDGAYSSSLTTLHAIWSSSDPVSGIADYQYAIGTSPGAQDVAPFTDAGLATQVTRTNLTLTNGATYYFAVTAVNGAGLKSAVGVSDGIRIDLTPPSTSRRYGRWGLFDQPYHPARNLVLIRPSIGHCGLSICYRDYAGRAGRRTIHKRRPGNPGYAHGPDAHKRRDLLLRSHRGEWRRAEKRSRCFRRHQNRCQSAEHTRRYGRWVLFDQPYHPARNLVLLRCRIGHCGLSVRHRDYAGRAGRRAIHQCGPGDPGHAHGSQPGQRPELLFHGSRDKRRGARQPARHLQRHSRGHHTACSTGGN